MLFIISELYIEVISNKRGIDKLDTLEEIKYYCNEKNPVGALLLTGEWGCGKTYFIENIVKKEIDSDFVLVRVSLFGISSIEEFNTIVKNRWIEECLPYCRSPKKEGFLQTGKKTLETIGNVTGKVSKVLSNVVLSINPEDFISIRPFVSKDKKEVILVFDDLERSDLNTVELLGCINDYCENQKFHVIVIANEEEIKSTIEGSGERTSEIKNSISYAEIKEKVVCRTIKYRPNYIKVISEVIKLTKDEYGDEYYKFLQENLEDIIKIYEYNDSFEQEQKSEEHNNAKRVHNVRSLKSAIHNFNRIYNEIKELEEIQLGEHLKGTVVLELMAKSNQIRKSKRYKYLFEDEKIKKMYPFIDFNCIFNAEREWIIENEWNQELLKNEIYEYNRKRNLNNNHKEKLKNYYFAEVDDEDINQGYEELLNECYEGKLTLNQYVLFIKNSQFLRSNGINQNVKLDWDRVIEGIKAVEKKEIEEAKKDVEYEISELFYCIENTDIFTIMEKKAYEEIEFFCINGGFFFERNKYLYIEKMNNGDISEIVFLKNNRFNVFDRTMAAVTLEYYNKISGGIKKKFPQYFIAIFYRLSKEKYLNFDDTLDGLDYFTNRLKGLIDKTKKEEKIIENQRLTALKKEVEQLYKEIEDKGSEN